MNDELRSIYIDFLVYGVKLWLNRGWSMGNQAVHYRLEPNTFMADYILYHYTTKG